MRVAIIIPRLEQLGPVKVIHSLVNALSETPDVHIRLFYLDKKTDPQLRFLVPVERLVSSEFPFAEFDIVHTNGIRPDLFAWVNRKKIKYHISTIHNFVFEDLSYTYNKLISLIFGNLWLLFWGRADKLVCVSGAIKTCYSKWYTLSKLEVIYNGVPETDIAIQPDSDVIQVINEFRSNGLKIIGSAGILTRRKGIDQILYLLEKEKEFALILIGCGKESGKLQKLAKKLNIYDRCFFCGFRSSAVNYFKYFDLLIMPSRSEGFGLALLEAVQQKVPVICSDIKVFNELFNRDEVSFFTLNDIDSLTSALRIARVTGKSKTDLAYSRYKSEYTDQKMARKYYQLYQSVS
jgi:glycosyltransferase involved in cell wall biosynthesis